jgi:hypothetical protein
MVMTYQQREERLLPVVVTQGFAEPQGSRAVITVVTGRLNVVKGLK